MKHSGTLRLVPRFLSAATRMSVGGQAVLEGVMMRSPKSFVVAVRRPDGQIVVREQSWETLLGGVKFLRWPFFRGAIVLVESLWNGMSALNFSAEQSLPDDKDDGKDDGKAVGKGDSGAERGDSKGAPASADGAPAPGSQDAAGDKPSDGKAAEEKAAGKGPKEAAKEPSGKEVATYEGAAPRSASKGEKVAMGFTMAFSIALGMALFVALPHALTWLLGEGTGLNLPVDGVAFHLVDGIFKALVFVAYLGAISLMEDIRRVFQYHGAEHKSIWAYESGRPLVPAEARTFTTLHPRCGTAFILIVLLVSIVLFAAVFPFVPQISSNRILNQLGLIAVKLPLMFPVAGIAYELQRLSAKDTCPTLIKVLLKPGLWMQKITTKEPSDDQLEVALVSLRRALGRENGVLSGPPEVRLYRDFAAAVAFEEAHGESGSGEASASTSPAAPAVDASQSPVTGVEGASTGDASSESVGQS